MVDAAPAGRTVTVPPCVYRETVTIGRPLTLDGRGAVIDGDGMRARWVEVRSDDVTLIGLAFHDSTFSRRWLPRQQHRLFP